MAIDKGNIKTSANYDVKAQKPLDGRAVRPTKADLIKKESWSSDGNTVYVYEGMQVYVQDEKKTYYLKDLSKMFASDFSGWELMGTGAGSGITEEKEVYIGSSEPPVGAKVWIDPTGTPSSPSVPSGGGGVKTYIIPQNIYDNSDYYFTEEESAAFREFLNAEKWYEWRVVFHYVIPNYGYGDTMTIPIAVQKDSDWAMEINFFTDGGIGPGAASHIRIEDQGDVVWGFCDI